MANLKHSPETTALLEHLRHLASTASSLEELQTNLVVAMASKLPHYSWTGFYMLEPQDSNTLILGPFVGDPTLHKRIPVNQGICGAAVATGETVIVDDVNSDPRYLSCSIKTKSEIVVPIYVYGKIIGEIDIDSHQAAAFTGEDRWFLEEVSGWSARSWNSHPLNEAPSKPRTPHNRIL
jgi:L-methionine (R)-S-oxide reductase